MGLFSQKRRIMLYIVKAGLALCLIGFFGIQISILQGSLNPENTPRSGGQGAWKWFDKISDSDKLEANLSAVPLTLRKYLTVKAPATVANLTANLTLPEIQHLMEEENRRQKVHNIESFPWPDVKSSNKSRFISCPSVIVVQVHTRLAYLRQLVVSLALVKDIHHALLVFSHDVWSEDINALVSAIDFAPAVQIFFPHSLQTHPHTFPGDSPGDCPRDVTKDKAKALGCTNAQTPDLYGHYREARFTQTKHHWWWKANYIFGGGLRIAEGFNGPVILLEEDHYVAEDLLYTLHTMTNIQNEWTRTEPPPALLTLGSYPKVLRVTSDGGLIEYMPWASSKHNMGMVLNRNLWQKFQQCAQLFCTLDDYNWDWSLQAVSHNCLDKPLTVLLPRVPRVFHIGECGVHHKKYDCQAKEVLKKVQRALGMAKPQLFPPKFTVNVPRGVKVAKLKKGNGGWADPRDHALCWNLTRVF